MKEKIYFKGVKKICRHDLSQEVEIFTISGRAQEMAEWILQHQTSDGWINIDIKRKNEPVVNSTHVAYLSPNQK
jgi:hypothetical protein